MRSRSMTSTRAAGSMSRMSTLVAPTASPASTQPPPPMWNSGMATRLTESGPKPMSSGYMSRPDVRLRLGELHALRPPRRARRVELVGDVVHRLRHHRVVGRMGVAPVGEAREGLRAADDEDRGVGQLAGDLLDDGRELLADGEHLGLGIGDDHRDLGRRQAEVHRGRHRVELGRAVEQLDLLRAVLVEVGDVVPGTDACRPQRLGHPARALVELAVGHLLVAPAQRRVVGLLGGPVTDRFSGGHHGRTPQRVSVAPPPAARPLLHRTPGRAQPGPLPQVCHDPGMRRMPSMVR